MERATLILLAALALSGCSSGRETFVHAPVEVAVPVVKRAEAPAELRELIARPPFPFITPNDPRAIAGLTLKDAEALVQYVNDLSARDDAWRAWAMAD